MQADSGPVQDLLPDVALADRPAAFAALDAVGMEGIQLPLAWALGDSVLTLPATLRAQVDLVDPAARGIHMSRLYLAADRGLAGQQPTAERLRTVLAECLASHRGLSSRASLRLDFALLLRRPALKSGLAGWRSYPVWLEARLHASGQFALRGGVRVLYSSTCPASAALARQLGQQQFVQDFGAVGQVAVTDVVAWLGSPQGMVATPHAQRSVADLVLDFDPAAMDLPPFAHCIDRCEQTLGTPVQTAVRRIDEQEFAWRNGQNLMFCEDAARRLHAWLSEEPAVRAFEARVSHLESLHAHDAVALVRGGQTTA